MALDGWAASPTRLAEDAALETDAAEIGYRDRLFTELAANAADASVAAGLSGADLTIWLQAPDALHVANRGAPLTAAGVRALSAMRVSDKSGESSVGRFGLGFHAVVSVCDRAEIRSRGGGVVFDRDLTRELAGTAAVPVLRLPWPVDTPPSEGFDTEVILTLRDGINPAGLLEYAAGAAVELLLELPDIGRITVSDKVFSRLETAVSNEVSTVVIDGGGCGEQWVQVRCPRARWLIAGSPSRVETVDPARNYLRAPTRTDIELTSPALCVADVPVTPDRRMLRPDADVSVVAEGYCRVVSAVAIDQRPALIPAVGVSAGRVDDEIREALRAELAGGRWLPGADGSDVIASRAVVIADVTEELAGILADLIDGLAHPSVSGRATLPLLRSVGVTEWGLARLCDLLAGVSRPPAWWGDLYDALLPLVVDDVSVAELGALPIPRIDGRMHVGVRGLMSLGSWFPAGGGDIDIDWLPVVHPDAGRALLDRMGIESAGPSTVLADPALRQLIDHRDGDVDPALTATVLSILAAVPEVSVPPWLGGLPVETARGELVPADELLLSDSPLAGVLVDDAPFEFVADRVVERYGAQALRRVGVGWGFALVRDDVPVAADHDLPDEERWWATLERPPETLAAVRDLDLVDSRRWARALSMLADDPEIVEVLADPAGYTCWWLRHFASIDGCRLGEYRAPSDTTFVGLYDPLDHPVADLFADALAGPGIRDAADANALLVRLADPGRTVSPGVASRAHAALAAAVGSGVVGLDGLDVPDVVRSFAGTTVDSAVVLDKPWLAFVLSADEMVTVDGLAQRTAELLADILDLPLASDEVNTHIRNAGTPHPVDSASAMMAAFTYGVSMSGSHVRLHDGLVVEVAGRGPVEVPWWCDSDGVYHVNVSRGQRDRR